ncbi:MAG: hypothetical protein OQK98_04135 [Gammaproteobacteria bacterium]|nr:hypothetical protein [Gammaproteobacteria bacterium]
MKKISSLLASLPLITTACGGGGGSDNTASNPTSTAKIDLTPLKGIWSETGIQTYTSASGKVTTFQAPTALVTSQEDMIILTGNSELYVIEAGNDTAHYFSSFAYSTEITPETKLTNTKFVFNYYNPKREANGSVEISADGHYDSILNLDSLGGTWNDVYNTNNWVFIIDNTDGSFTAERNGPCTASGNLSNIDGTKSELAVSITFTGCAPLVGTHTGFAWPEEGLPNTLNMAVYSTLDISGKAIGWKLNRP